jgi:hypothetical protein
MGKKSVNWVRGFALMAFLLLTPPRTICAGDKPGDLEYKVKAVLLVKLISYVEWPTNAFANADAPFQIAVLGGDPFGEILEKVFEGEFPKGHRAEIKRVKTAGECANCQVVFISRSEKERFANELREISAATLLTVSDIDAFARKGGMVGMIRDEKNVRFEVNIEACRQARLGVSSRLSSLARVVTTDK